MIASKNLMLKIGKDKYPLTFDFYNGVHYLHDKENIANALAFSKVGTLSGYMIINKLVNNAPEFDNNHIDVIRFRGETFNFLAVFCCDKNDKKELEAIKTINERVLVAISDEDSNKLVNLLSFLKEEPSLGYIFIDADMCINKQNMKAIETCFNAYSSDITFIIAMGLNETPNNDISEKDFFVIDIGINSKQITKVTKEEDDITIRSLFIKKPFIYVVAMLFAAIGLFSSTQIFSYFEKNAIYAALFLAVALLCVGSYFFIVYRDFSSYKTNNKTLESLPRLYLFSVIIGIILAIIVVALLSAIKVLFVGEKIAIAHFVFPIVFVLLTLAIPFILKKHFKKQKATSAESSQRRIIK